MFSEKIELILEEFLKSEKCEKSDIEIYVFPQLWGSTSCGYSMAGGSAMTTSHTIVFFHYATHNVMLSYGGRFIELKEVNRLFLKDLSDHRISPEYQLSKYTR